MTRKDCSNVYPWRDKRNGDNCDKDSSRQTAKDSPTTKSMYVQPEADPEYLQLRKFQSVCTDDCFFAQQSKTAATAANDVTQASIYRFDVAKLTGRSMMKTYQEEKNKI